MHCVVSPRLPKGRVKFEKKKKKKKIERRKWFAILYFVGSTFEKYPPFCVLPPKISRSGSSPLTENMHRNVVSQCIKTKQVLKESSFSKTLL